ncbi:hypothetical protein BDR22DRAFT_69291 [Usnea florida]
MWDLLEKEPLFRVQDSASRHDPQAHLAEMMTILGPPPYELLNKGRKISSYFDANGLELENTTSTLDTKEREWFCRFDREMLRWMPEVRKTAKQLLNDPWLQT